ncbi:hypothetical protein JCM8097_002157 [Rhodosporidiobolus ruineniae]
MEPDGLPPPPVLARLKQAHADPKGKGKAREDSLAVYTGAPVSSNRPSIQASRRPFASFLLSSAGAIYRLLSQIGLSYLSSSLPQASSSRSSANNSAPTTALMRDGSMSTSTRRRLGALGIPIGPSSEEGDNDDDPNDGDDEPFSSSFSSGSLQPNPPASPSNPMLDVPEATYSRGGSTRSGPSTRAGETTDGPAFVSEESFRDIVDELTRQNQQLKAKLKRFESARVPNELRKERLFEIRWHEGLPKNRRREIESFLTGYVQSFSGSGTASSSSRAIGNSDERTMTQDASETTSSLGATLRSLRSSEKEAIKEVRQERRDSGSKGSGSKGSGDKLMPLRGGKVAPTAADSPSAPSASLLDPPALLRRPTDIFPSERDVLAAPSFSGAEPRSLTGTGTGMRISDPSNKRRKRKHSSTPDHPVKSLERPAYPRRRSASFPTSIASEDLSDPERLESLVVEMVERLFLESLPIEGADPATATPPPNPLHSEPTPLPAQSSTNTQYLRALLASEETDAHNGWLYLNLISTFASLHRLNVTVGLVRHALRTKSDLIEVSEEGTKIRWRGPPTKPVRKAEDPPPNAFSMGDMEGNDVEATQMQVDRGEEGGEDDGASSQSSEAEGQSLLRNEGGAVKPRARRGSGEAGTGSGTGSGSNSRNDASKGSTAVSTAPTSQHPSDRKNGESSNGTQMGDVAEVTRSHSSHERTTESSRPAQSNPVPLPASALRHTVDELTEPSSTLDAAGPPDVLGSAPTQVRPKHLYTPLIFQTARSVSDDGKSTTTDESAQSSTAADKSADSDGRPAKRRKGYDGGVVFFANDLFFSDLAGDSPKRMARAAQAQQEVENASDKLPLDVLGYSSSSAGATGSSSGGRKSRGSRSASPLTTEGSDLALPSRSSRSMEVETVPGDLDEASSLGVMSLDEAPDSWDGIDDLSIHKPGKSRPDPDGEFDVFVSLPFPTLQLSGTGETTASDHFTIQVKLLHPSSPTPPPASLPPSGSRPIRPPGRPSKLLSSHTIHHHASVATRFPRVRMRLGSTTSDSDLDLRYPDLSGSGYGLGVASGSLSPTSSQLRRLERRLPPNMGGGAGDYLMSLALPLNRWAPETRRYGDSEGRSGSRATGDDLIHL